RFEVGDAAAGGLVGNRLSVRRPARAILGVLGRGDAANRTIRKLRREKIVVEDEVRVGLAVRDEGDLVRYGRPIDGVLGVDAVRELTHPLRRKVRDKDVQAAVVIEPRVAFRRGRLVEITRDDLRVAVRVGGLGTGSRMYAGKATTVRRPGHAGGAP